ncbi:MAG TPA: O-antigen ligase family protein [Candidatus Dormibacteraeota bacterium]
MQAVETEAMTAVAASTPRRSGFAAAVTAVVAASWLPVLAGATTRTAVGWVAAVALAVAVEWLTRRFTAGVLVCSLVVSSAFVASGLVTDSTHYMPVAVTGGALGLRAALEAWRSRRLVSLTPRIVLVAAGLYLAWAALATLTSIDHRVSAVYLAGMVAVIALAIWWIPGALSERSDRENLLASVGVLGLIIALSVYVVAIAGSVNVFGRAVGDYQLAELTLGGHSTGLLFGRSSGMYLAPFEAGMTMAVSVGTLLGWSAGRAGRPLAPALLGIFIMVPAMLLTLDRTAWLAVILSAGAIAVLTRAGRFHTVTATVVCLVFAAVFLAVLVGGVGANSIFGSCRVNCPTSPDSTLRGGTGLSGRETLWRASIYAIEKRPIVGYGPGNNVPALYPYLKGGANQIETLTSHSAWFRAGVEMGIPGLAFLVWVLAIVAWIFIRGQLRGESVRDPVDLALGASLAGLIPALTFESLLLGGVTFTSLILAVALGLVAVPLSRLPSPQATF